MKGEFFRDNLSIFSSVKPLFNNVRLIYKLINIPETELAPLVLRGETLLRLLSSTCNCESAAFPPNTSKDLVDIHIYIQLEKSKFLNLFRRDRIIAIQYAQSEGYFGMKQEWATDSETYTREPVGISASGGSAS